MDDHHRAGVDPREYDTIFASFNKNKITTQGNYNTSIQETHYHAAPVQETSLKLTLLSRAALGALHDSEARYPQPNVLPGTREKIIQELTDWVEDSSVDKAKAHWVFGTAGVGKSAIAQALSEKFIQSEQLAAAFFFSRNDASRDKLDPFIATVAHQLVTSTSLGPLLAPLIDHTIRSTPEIWAKNWEIQFNVVLQEPCAQVDPKKWKDLPRLVIIDGVDECIDVMSQERLLETILGCSTTLPLDFLIFSRPEPHITRCLRHKTLDPAPRIMSLRDFAVRNDIELYLRKEFDHLKEDHRGILPDSWPGDDVIAVLVRKSTGQFIYVTTVVKYLRTGRIPVTVEQRLQVELSTEPVLKPTSPYPDLDQLYSQIVQFCLNDGRKLQRVLRLIVSPINPADLRIEETPLRPSGSPPMVPVTSAIAIEQLLGLEQGEYTALLSGLHSILHIPGDRNESVSVMHASFTDFLLDPNRSGDYHVGQRLLPKEWKEMVMVYQAKWLSRLSSRYEGLTPPLDGVHDHEFGSLNLWKYLYNNLCHDKVPITDEIVGVLNEFNPHQYLAMVTHWGYEWDTLDLRVEVEYSCHDFRDHTHHIRAVNLQMRMLYSTFHLLKRKYPRKLRHFVTKCASFFRGFYVESPSVQRTPVLLLSCQLFMSCLSLDFPDMDAVDSQFSFIWYSSRDENRYGATFRVLPSSQSKRGVPPGLEMVYVSPIQGHLLWELLRLLFEVYDHPVPVTRVMEIISSKQIEDWPRALAKLDRGNFKTWRIYMKYQQPWYGLYRQCRINIKSLVHRHYPTHCHTPGLHDLDLSRISFATFGNKSLSSVVWIIQDGLVCTPNPPTGFPGSSIEDSP